MFFGLCEEKGGKELLIGVFFWAESGRFQSEEEEEEEGLGIRIRMSGFVFSYRLILLGPPSFFLSFFLSSILSSILVVFAASSRFGKRL